MVDVVPEQQEGIPASPLPDCGGQKRVRHQRLCCLEQRGSGNRGIHHCAFGYVMHGMEIAGRSARPEVG